jgi:excisionase family DNA binding protein
MQTGDLPLAVSPARGAALLGVSRTRFYELLRKEIPFKKLGRRTLIAVADIERWLASQPTQAKAFKEPATITPR